MENQEMYHHGVKGQKWGFRRFQNKDGSLTSLGRQRYGGDKSREKARAIKDEARERIKKIKAQGRAESRVAKAKERADAKIAKAEAKYLPKKKGDTDGKSKPKSISEMSDAEIRERINRVRLENELKSITPQQVSKGQRFVSSLAKDVIGPAARDAGKRLMTDFLMKKGAELLGVDKKEVKDAASELQKEVSYLKNLRDKDVIEQYFKKRQEEDNAAKSAKKDSKAAEKQASKDTKATEKQTSKDDKTSEKQAKKDAKAAEKQAKKDAKAAEKQASKESKGVEEPEVIIEDAPSYKSKGAKTSRRYEDIVIDVDATVDDVAKNYPVVSRGRDYVTSLLELPSGVRALPYREDD